MTDDDRLRAGLERAPARERLPTSSTFWLAFAQAACDAADAIALTTSGATSRS